MPTNVAPVPDPTDAPEPLHAIPPVAVEAVPGGRREYDPPVERSLSPLERELLEAIQARDLVTQAAMTNLATEIGKLRFVIGGAAVTLAVGLLLLLAFTIALLATARGVDPRPAAEASERAMAPLSPTGGS